MARPRRSDGTRKRILDEGVTQLTARGFHGTGLQELLDRCSVPKGSFYNYFSSKEEFGVAAIEHYAESVAAALRESASGAPDPLTGLERFFRRLVREFEQSRFQGGCMVVSLAGEMDHNEPCRAALKRAFDAWRDGVARLLREAQEQGQVRRDHDAERLADLLTEAWEGAVIRMKIDRSVAPLERCIALYLNGFLRCPR